MNAGLETPWRSAGRCSRRAQVIDTALIASTGTARLRLRVIDGRPFDFDPGQFIGTEAHVPGVGRRASPYCILSAPTGGPVVELLVRLVDDGPLAGHLGALQPGDIVASRGPTGRALHDNRSRSRRAKDRPVSQRSAGKGKNATVLIANGLGPGDLTAERFGEFSALCAAGIERPIGRRTLRVLVGHLRDLGAVPDETVDASPVDELIVRYRSWMIEDRALAPSTIRRYQETARRFLTARAAAGRRLRGRGPVWVGGV